jgi:hypothetical protein
MSQRVRKAALVLAPAIAVSIVGASLLIGLLGGNWLAFLGLAVLIGVTGFAAFVALYSWNAQKRPAPRPKPSPRWREREGRRDGYVSDGPEFVEHVVGGFDDDRDRWAP